MIRHDCGDPACDGKAFARALRACTHEHLIELVGAYGYELFDSVFWCKDCGALGVPEPPKGAVVWRPISARRWPGGELA